MNDLDFARVASERDRVASERDMYQKEAVALSEQLDQMRTDLRKSEQECERLKKELDAAGKPENGPDWKAIAARRAATIDGLEREINSLQCANRELKTRIDAISILSRWLG